jgi:hypothetical protein
VVGAVVGAVQLESIREKRHFTKLIFFTFVFSSLFGERPPPHPPTDIKFQLSMIDSHKAGSKCR